MSGRLQSAAGTRPTVDVSAVDANGFSRRTVPVLRSVAQGELCEHPREPGLHGGRQLTGG